MRDRCWCWYAGVSWFVRRGEATESSNPTLAKSSCRSPGLHIPGRRRHEGFRCRGLVVGATDRNRANGKEEVAFDLDRYRRPVESSHSKLGGRFLRSPAAALGDRAEMK